MTRDDARNRSAPNLIAIACCAEVFAMLGFSAFATLLPVLAKDFALNNAQAGLISGVLLGGFMASVPLLGPLTDRVDARRVYGVAACIASLGAAGFALYASGFWSAFFCQLLIGIGLAGTYIPGMKALSDRLQGIAQSRGAAFYGATFGVGAAVSMALCGLVAAAFGWRTAFVVVAVGPLIAAAIVLYAFEAAVPKRVVHTALLDFRPVWANRDVRPYLFATAAHAWELYATRAWVVAFLTFADSLRTDADRLPIAVAVVASAITLLGPVASVTGNEFAHRYGRARLITIAALSSSLASFAVGFLAPSPWAVLLIFTALHTMFTLIDGSVITAGMVAAADPARRGSTMAVYSFMGFGAGFIAPTCFGVVLDFAGGRESSVAWGYAFASLGLVGLLAIIPARSLAQRERRTRH